MVFCQTKSQLSKAKYIDVKMYREQNTNIKSYNYIMYMTFL